MTGKPDGKVWRTEWQEIQVQAIQGIFGVNSRKAHGTANGHAGGRISALAGKHGTNRRRMYNWSGNIDKYKEEIRERFNYSKRCEQIDDLCIIGVEI